MWAVKVYKISRTVIEGGSSTRLLAPPWPLSIGCSSGLGPGPEGAPPCAAAWRSALRWEPQAAGGQLLCAWSTFCPASALTLGSAGLLLSHSALPAAETQQCFPFIKSALSEVQLASLIGSALAGSGSRLEPTGAGTDLTWGNFRTLLTEATPANSHCQNFSNISPIHRWISSLFYYNDSLTIFCFSFDLS